MDILVIGNGFDLAHGLETRYKDFLDFPQNTDFKDYIDKLPNYKKCLQTNVWLKHFINNYKNLNGENWIDFEEEIFEVILSLNNHSLDKYFSNGSHWLIKSIDFDINSFFNLKNINNLMEKVDTEHYELRKRVDFEFLKEKGYSIILNMPYEDTMCVYIQDFKGFIAFLYDQLRELTEAFQEYITQYVLCKVRKEIFDLTIRQKGRIINTGHIFVLNFNYTNICEKLYKNSNLNIETIFLHGDVKKQDFCNLVLGSKSYADFQEDINPEYNVFQKHNQRHKYGTVETYQDFYHEKLSKILDSVQVNYHVIGHSLDESDQRLLKSIFNAKKDSIIYIYYHEEKIHQKLIKNITEIITEDEVTTRVRFVKQNDKHRGILQERKGIHTISRSLN